jgi:Fe-S-cluster containining protein
MNCASCPNHCCGKNKAINAPVLFPFEYATFNQHLVKVEDNLYRLKRDKQTGCCVYLHNSRCLKYDIRPLECRLFPWVLQYDRKKGLHLKLHPACPSRMAPPRPSLPREVLVLPEEYWLKFEKLTV